MKLSVIIVNYNVKHFLEQCLYSVYKALDGIRAEVIVVDNNSVDGSEMMLRSKFPGVKLLVNQQNVGFAKANNQALQTAKGEYLLLLNPDTVVEESTFKQCLAFMDTHPQAGALGPKMIDGKGRFLPESKRGLPTPEVAFYKIFGLTRLFPTSKKFGRYYLGHTSNESVQEVDVLTGAFMLIRHSVLDNIGYLDEAYFMYGEDIDLSYRVQKAGFKNFYFPETSIIHYKGESTKKGSLNYVLIFYKAMQVFAAKHFSGNMAKTYTAIINLAIYLRAIMSLLKRSFIKSVPLLFDAALAYLGFYQLTLWWGRFYFQKSNYYSDEILYKAIPLFVVVLLLANTIAGGYKSPFNLLKAVKGAAYGTLLILVIYALLPVQYRFSRALVLIGAVWALVSILMVRFSLSLTRLKEYRLDLNRKRRIAIVGFEEEAERIRKLLEMSGVIARQVINVYPSSNPPSEYFSGTVQQMPEIIAIHQIKEIIFCAKDISSEAIIDYMKMLKNANVDFKIASPGSTSLVGSNSAKSAGDLYVVKVNSLDKRKMKL